MPLQATSGAASYDGFGGGVPYTPTYIEDVFSTWLYTGNGTFSPKTGVNTITNGIDLAGKGGLVWAKIRDSTGWHSLFDTNRGVSRVLSSNATDAQSFVSGQGVTSFNSNGFTLEGNLNGENRNGFADVAWTFRKQPKFFDVVTYTGNGTSQTINHNLGSVPGCIIVKNLDGQNNWRVYHRSLGATKNLQLNLTDAENTNSGVWNDTAPTSTQFTVGSNGNVNRSGEQHVAYLFAHNAGGFGLTGADNVISCGSFTVPSGSSTSVNLGFEPQWLLFKPTSTTGDWLLADNMRGFRAGPINGSTSPIVLRPNTSGVEGTEGELVYTESTGFSVAPGGTNPYSAGTQFIYIAIRRGPMKTPTSGTSVFTPVQNSNFTAGVVIAGQPIVDVSWSKQKDAVNPMRIFDRLRGSTTSTNNTLDPSSTAAEVNEPYWAMDQQNGVRITQTLGTFNYINYFFSRAPGFFDEVCYTGNGTYGATNHNLGVIPELTIYKKRSGTAENWGVIYYLSSISYRFGNLNLTDAFTTYTNNPAVAGLFSSTQFCKYYDTSGQTYVAYLFASCPGVSKVGSYTGTGALQTINCGFTGGARFVLIKRTDSTGDWYCWDSSRGIVSGNDSYLVLNSTAAEVTNTDWVDTYSAGFELSNAAGNNVNINGASYIFLSVA